MGKKGLEQYLFYTRDSVAISSIERVQSVGLSSMLFAGCARTTQNNENRAFICRLKVNGLDVVVLLP